MLMLARKMPTVKDAVAFSCGKGEGCRGLAHLTRQWTAPLRSFRTRKAYPYTDPTLSQLKSVSMWKGRRVSKVAVEFAQISPANFNNAIDPGSIGPDASCLHPTIAVDCDLPAFPPTPLIISPSPPHSAGLCSRRTKSRESPMAQCIPRATAYAMDGRRI